THDAKLVEITFAMVEDFADFAPCPFTILGVNLRKKPVDVKFFAVRLEAKQTPDHLGPIGFSRRHIPFPGTDTRCLLREAQTALTLGQGDVSFSPFGDITHHT